MLLADPEDRAIETVDFGLSAVADVDEHGRLVSARLVCHAAQKRAGIVRGHRNIFQSCGRSDLIHNRVRVGIANRRLIVPV